MTKHDLRFLLKDKYNLTETEIEAFTSGGVIRSRDLAEGIKKDIRKLKKGYPLAYLIGWVEFLGCKIDLRHNPLIPRPETEYWVDKAVKVIKDQPEKAERELEELEDQPGVKQRFSYNYNQIVKILEDQPRKILDIFCGSGCIGISVLKNIKIAHVTFADISECAIKQTKLNLKINKISANNYEIIKSDIFENVKDEKDKLLKFDCIFANPPYISKNDPIGKEVLYEPKETLFDDKNIVEKFLKQAPDHLRPGGTIFMEFGYNQKKFIKSLCIKNDIEPTFYKDQFGKLRWMKAQVK